jgi:CRP-like cAMP-binding protein
MLDAVLTGHGLKGEDLERFQAELRPMTLGKGAYFIRSGQQCRYIALVENGCLRTFHIDVEGHEVTTDFSGPGSFCSSYYSFYTSDPSFEFIEAVVDSELLLLSYDSLQKLYADSFGINVFGRRILEKACIERDLRLKKITHLSAIERYQWFNEHYSEICNVATLGSIASFLGMKRETLSRVRSRMRP